MDDGVLDFVKADFLAFIDSGSEVFALKHLLHSDSGVESEDVFEGHFTKPFSIVDDFGFGFVENFEGLGGVSFGVGENFFAGKRRAGG